MILKRLIEMFARELRTIRLASALARADDAAFAADTALLEDMRRDRGRFVARIPVRVPDDDCVLPDCSTCTPSAPPLDVVAEEQRAREVAYAASWATEHYPEVWYFEDAAKLHRFAAGIVALRHRVRAERRVAL